MRHHLHLMLSLIALGIAGCYAIAQTIITDSPVPTPLNGVLDADIYRGNGNVSAG